MNLPAQTPPPPEADGRWSRLAGVVDVGRLGRSTAVVVGLGSGGSTVALELAKAGVGRLVLVDPGHLEKVNVIRHECDDRYVHWPKARAVAELAAYRNPRARIEPVVADALDLGARLERHVADADVVAVCTDVEAPKLLLNRLCLGAGVTAVYGGVYRGGVGGEVIRCGGGPTDPCYACVASVLERSVPEPAVNDGDLDYGVVEADGSLGRAPGLGIDVRFVALIHARMCLGAITGTPNPPSPVVLFGLEAVEGLFPRPFASALVDVAPQAGCLVCSPVREGALDVQ